ncbi:MAG: glutathione peroxidase [Gammaproteobacteria bacterium]|jgi:glutaredoxin-like protein|nr:glutathione peroxidase [Gammaproteobacteria bacterium]
MLENHEGQRVPDVIFKTRQGSDWVDVSTQDIFAGKTVVVFSLPGAFTPTCSSQHVPRYNELVSTFKANGVDEVVCVSVNDAFVMNEWQIDQCADNLRFLPDGTGEFTKGMGMLVNKDDLGFGMRSWRYSMLVRDGVVEKMFIEPEVEGDPFDVSDADTMLKYINAEAQAPLDVTILTRDGCGFCARAKELLGEAGIEYSELKLNKDFRHSNLRALAGANTVPQVFINGELIGGSEALEAWLDNRKAA